MSGLVSYDSSDNDATEGEIFETKPVSLLKSSVIKTVDVAPQVDHKVIF